jgi:DNA helicase TIP49 (TBP-interacting protein)
MAQKRMLISMTGPQIRREIDAMIPMTFEERDAHMKKMSMPKLEIMAEMVSDRYVGKLNQIMQAIVWENPNKSQSLEVQGRRL